MVAFWLLFTDPVAAVNVALLWSAWIDTLAGTVTKALLLLSDTDVIAAAFWFSATVQMLDALLPSVDGAQESDVIRASALTVRAKVLEPPLRVAVNMAFWFEFTAPTEALKVALPCPAVIVALLGTVTLASLLERVMVNPPACAGAVKPTVQVALPGAFTVAGKQVKLPSWTVVAKLSVTD